MDINAWLEEATKRSNIPAEDRKILEGVIAKNAGLATYLEESGLRQSDYDRKMNKLKEEHQARLQEVAPVERARVAAGPWPGAHAWPPARAISAARWIAARIRG